MTTWRPQVRSPDICWPLVIIWYYCRVAKDYPYCCHNVLRWDLQCLYASEALAAIASHRSQHIQENVKFWGITIKKKKKSKNLRQITGKRQVHPVSVKPTGANGLWYRKTEKKEVYMFCLCAMWYYIFLLPAASCAGCILLCFS